MCIPSFPNLTVHTGLGSWHTVKYVTLKFSIVLFDPIISFVWLHVQGKSADLIWDQYLVHTDLIRDQLIIVATGCLFSPLGTGPAWYQQNIEMQSSW